MKLRKQLLKLNETELRNYLLIQEIKNESMEDTIKRFAFL
jgi:hypothetical protein